MRTNKETHRSIARKSFIVKILLRLYLEAATQRCSLKLVFLKCWQQKQLFSGKAILKEHLSPLTILLKRLEPEHLVFENIANHSADLIKNAQSRTYFKCIFNSNILWNLEFAIFDFTRYKTLVHGARFPYSSLMRTEQNQIYLL